MTRTSNILSSIFAELYRAEAKHPDWPDDPVEAASILLCEAGETLKAACKYRETGDASHLRQMETEAVQTGAMVLRLLINLEDIRR